MSTPQNYSAGLVKRAQRFADAQLASQRKMQQDVIVPQLPGTSLRPTGHDWSLSEALGGTLDWHNVQIATEQSQQLLNSRYNYSYQIPEETKFLSHRKFTDDAGYARFDILDKKQTQIGNVHVTDQYWDFVVKEMEREEAMGLKAFIFNTMLRDFNRPTGKKYWKKRCPELFEELRQALIFKHQNQFNKAMVALNEPQTEEEWRFVYDQFVKPDAYGTTQVLNGAVPDVEYLNPFENPGLSKIPTALNLKKEGIYNLKGSNFNGINPPSAKLYGDEHIKLDFNTV